MAKNKKVLILVLAFALVLLLIGAGWLYFGNASDQNLRVMGFPSLSAVPDGFTSVDANTIDTGDWCEITYQNNAGDFLSLDCYELGTFDIAFLMNYANTTEQMSVKGKGATVYKDLAGNDQNLRIIAWEDEGSNALCLLGGNLAIDEMVKAAQSIRYDRKKAVTKAETNVTSITPQARGTIEQTYLKKYAEVLENTTKPDFDQWKEQDKAILKFELESFYKSFLLSTSDNLLVEIFNYDYFMKAKDNVIIAGGMHRGKDGNIRHFIGSFGQIAAVSREGQLIKVQPLTKLDVILNPEGASEESQELIKGKVLTGIKSPAYFVRDAYHY